MHRSTPVQRTLQLLSPPLAALGCALRWLLAAREVVRRTKALRCAASLRRAAAAAVLSRRISRVVLFGVEELTNNRPLGFVS